MSVIISGCYCNVCSSCNIRLQLHVKNVFNAGGICYCNISVSYNRLVRTYRSNRCHSVFILDCKADVINSIIFHHIYIRNFRNYRSVYFACFYNMQCYCRCCFLYSISYCICKCIITGCTYRSSVEKTVLVYSYRTLLGLGK